MEAATRARRTSASSNWRDKTPPSLTSLPWMTRPAQYSRPGIIALMRIKDNDKVGHKIMTQSGKK